MGPWSYDGRHERPGMGPVVSFLPSTSSDISTQEGMHTAMFSRVRIAIRFFFVGLAVGVLLAPRSGEETRRMLRQKADRLLNDVLDAATLGTAQTGASDRELTRTEQVEAPQSTAAGRSNGGSARGRSRSAAGAESTAGAGS
jgi:hypothetical protein